LLHLPGNFKTMLQTIPAKIPYVCTDPERVEHWTKELSAIPGIRVGISWQGSTDHRGDRIRSVPLSRFGWRRCAESA
jgi:hypothetical protein